MPGTGPSVDQGKPPVNSKSMWLRLSVNFLVFVGASFFAAWLCALVGLNTGLSTRMRTEHIHTTGQPSYQVGLATSFARPDETRMVVLRTENSVDDKIHTSTGVHEYYRTDHMCDVKTCVTTTTWPACLCDEFKTNEKEHGECEYAAKPMDLVLHDSKNKDGVVRHHFESSDAEMACHASYMNNVVVTTNNGMGVLCTHAPQLLGIVLLVLLALWSFEGMLDIYLQEMGGDWQVDSKDMPLKQGNVKWAKFFVFFLAAVLLFISTFTASRQWADTIDLPKSDVDWKYAQLKYTDGSTSWETDKHAWHLKRSIPWGSVCYFAAVLLFWALSTLMGYTLDFRMPSFGRGNKVAPGETGGVTADVGYLDTPTYPLIEPTYHDDGEPSAPPYVSSSTIAHNWNLQAFGMAPVVRPHYSVLIHTTSPAKIEWDTFGTHQNHSMYKILLLLTAVLLTVVMHNSYVLDVVLWSLVFSVIAYGVLDVALRRTYELLCASSGSDNPGYGGLVLLGLGYVIKVLAAGWGLYLLNVERQLSPAYTASLLHEELSTSEYVLNDEEMFLGNEDNMFLFTGGLWALLFISDAFADGSNYRKSNKASQVVPAAVSNDDTVTKVVEVNTQNHWRWQAWTGFVFLVFAVYTGLVCTQLFYMPAEFDKYRHFKQGGDSPKFTAYEWHRNNWLHGVHA